MEGVDATENWFEKAIGQHDPIIPGMLRQWYGRAFRNTPRCAGLMRKRLECFVIG